MIYGQYQNKHAFPIVLSSDWASGEIFKLLARYNDLNTAAISVPLIWLMQDSFHEAWFMKEICTTTQKTVRVKEANYRMRLIQKNPERKHSRLDHYETAPLYGFESAENYY